MRRIINYFSKENSVRGASLILIVTLALSNILGLFRDRFLTKNIATSQLDIYQASFRLPDLIFNFLILGAITSAFIPIFSDYIAKDDLDEGYKVTNSLVNLAFLAMIALALILIIFMPFIMPLVVPKFDAERMASAIRISRLFMLTPIFFSFSYILGGVLNSFKRFVAYSIAPLIYNLAIIFGAAVLAPRFGLMSVVYSVVVGSILHALVQLPSAFALGFRFRAVLDWRHASIRRIIRLMIPRSIGMGVNQVMLVVYTAIGSALTAGSIAAFTFANNIQTMPTVVFGTSFATAVFPTLTRKISEGDKEGFAFYFNRSIRSIAYLLTPSTVVFILLRAQITRLILGSGKFSWDDTRRTAMTLGFFAISFLAQGLTPIFARAFYALKNTRTPMYISIVTAIVSIALAYPLVPFLGVAGLALAYSIGSFINLLLLYVYLRHSYPGIMNASLILSYVKIMVISIVMGSAMWLAIHFMASHVNMNRFMGLFEQTLVALIVAGIVYFALSYFFGCEEMKWAITRKINGRSEEKS